MENCKKKNSILNKRNTFQNFGIFPWSCDGSFDLFKKTPENCIVTDLLKVPLPRNSVA